MPERLRGKGDDDRHADQRRERIGKAPGDEQQGAQLQQVEPEHREGRNRLQPVGRREAHGEQEIGRRQGADRQLDGQDPFEILCGRLVLENIEDARAERQFVH